jgi:hypothetical protein
MVAIPGVPPAVAPYRAKPRFGSISSVSFDSNPASNRNNAANAIIAALSVHNHGAALFNSNP